MTTLNLTPDQAVILKETLNSFLSDMGMEIADTDNYDFRQMLKKRRELLEGILAMLGNS